MIFVFNLRRTLSIFVDFTVFQVAFSVSLITRFFIVCQASGLAGISPGCHLANQLL